MLALETMFLGAPRTTDWPLMETRVLTRTWNVWRNVVLQMDEVIPCTETPAVGCGSGLSCPGHSVVQQALKGMSKEAEVLAAGMDFQLQTSKNSKAPGPVSQDPGESSCLLL